MKRKVKIKVEKQLVTVEQATISKPISNKNDSGFETVMLDNNKEEISKTVVETDTSFRINKSVERETISTGSTVKMTTSSPSSEKAKGTISDDFTKPEPNIQKSSHHMETRKMEPPQTFDIVNFITVMNEKTGGKTYKCSKCDKQCDRRYNMKQHCQIHRKKITTTYSCKLCGKKYLQKPWLQLHMKFHTGKDLYKCAECFKSFSKESYFKKHMEIHERKRLKNVVTMHPCELCDKTFIKSRTLQMHMKFHTDKGHYKCYECSKSFSREFAFKEHMKIHETKSLTETEPSLNEVQQLYDCTHCEKKFKNKIGLNKHIQNYSAERKFECSECHLKFKQKNNLTRHMKTHVKTETVSQNLYFNKETNTYDCDQCCRKYQQSFSLTSHMKLHTGTNLHQCSKCDKKFEYISTLRRHMRTHVIPGLENPNIYFNKETNTYDCNICNRKYQQSFTLTFHMKQHTRNNLYQCLKCQTKFGNKSLLQRHMRTHAIRRLEEFYSLKTSTKFLFKCPLVNCSVKVKSRGQLKYHLQSHNVEKPFKCSLCDQCFRARCTLKIHMDSRHKPQKPTFKCQQCKASYESKKGLYYHIQESHKNTDIKISEIISQTITSMFQIKKNTDKNLVQCSICFENFTHDVVLRKHMKNHVTDKSKDVSIVLSEKSARDVPDGLFHEMQTTDENQKPDIKIENIGTVRTVITGKLISEKNEIVIDKTIPSTLSNKYFEQTICKEELILPDESI